MASSAKTLIDASGIKGGLVAYVGHGKGEPVSGLCNDTTHLIHVLCDNRREVDALRRQIQEQGQYGRVSVEYWAEAYLPYTDNLVNLLVVEDRNAVSVQEAMRVLAPLGVACFRTGSSWDLRVKRWPKEIDQWTHYLHGPDNNAVAQDTKVGPPQHLQWIGDPKFARSHEQLASVSAMVSARGRLFYIVDEGLTSDIRMPSHWHLVARDAFNGVVLWKRTIGNWTDHLHSFRSGPADLPFRLVADGDRVYVTLGIDAPVTALDAATGKTLVTYHDSEKTRQIACTGDTLVMLGGERAVSQRRTGPSNESSHRFILAADAATGTQLWQKTVSDETYLPLVVSGDAIVYQTRNEVICLNLKSGVEKWRTAHPANIPKSRPPVAEWATPTLTAHGDIVYVADFSKLFAFSLADGTALWNCSSAPGFCSPPDVFVSNGLLWRGYQKSRYAADFGEGLDATTGVLRKTLATKKAWDYATLAHHRCYRPKATSRFILSSRSGVEFINIESGEIYPNHWVRGTCQYGVLPCNGLLYAPPHSCACNIKTMLKGLHALAPADQAVSLTRTDRPRLEKGPAYGHVSNALAVGVSDDAWPTFRHDNERTGTTTAHVPHLVRQQWGTQIGGRLSSPVMSQARVYVAAIDAHQVHALDAADGHKIWSYTAGGRVDSPPTIFGGMVLFGAADGWVYALRATDGALVWRFRGAPADRYVVVRNQVESAWPIHGSVLVRDGKAIVAAGRSSYLDGGISVYQLDPSTGKQLSVTVIFSPDPKTGEQPAGGVDLRGVLNDVLAASGSSVYMRHLKLDLKNGGDLATGPPHLFAPLGFLDDTWWHRSYWLYASDEVAMPPRNESGWSIWPRMGNMVPSGRILSLGEKLVFGYGRDRYPGGMAGQIRGGEHYHLFAAERYVQQPLPVNRTDQHLRYARSGERLGLKVTERNKRYGEPTIYRFAWSQQVPIYVKALALANTTLCLAGPRELPETRTDQLTLADPDSAEAAFLGGKGAELQLVNAVDGEPVSRCTLDATPVFDGLIAAGGRIFISLMDGSIVCFGDRDLAGQTTR